MERFLAAIVFVPLLSCFACTRDEPRASSPAASRAPSAPSTAGAPLPPPSAPSASAVPGPIERLTWAAPPSWRDLGVSLQGVTKGHFQALVDNPHEKVPEEVEVFVVHHEGARGDTPEARMAVAVQHEADPFTKVEWKKSETRIVGGRKFVILEIHGTMRELVPMPPDYEPSPQERPHRAEITAFVPTKTFPYRVALHGREDLVERVREDFLRFVDSLRVENEEAP